MYFILKYSITKCNSVLSIKYKVQRIKYTFSIYLLFLINNMYGLWNLMYPLICTLKKWRFPPFSEIVRLLMSMQVDRINQRRLFWSGKYVNPNSKEYKTLEGESNYAVSGKRKNQLSQWVDNKQNKLTIFPLGKYLQEVIMKKLFCVFLLYF